MRVGVRKKEEEHKQISLTNSVLLSEEKLQLIIKDAVPFVALGPHWRGIRPHMSILVC